MQKIKAYFTIICLSLALFSCSSDTGDGGTTTGTEGGTTKQPVTGGGEKKPDKPKVEIEPKNEFETFLAENLFNIPSASLDESLNKMISPKIGVYLVYKPGAVPIAKKHLSTKELKDSKDAVIEDLVGIGDELNQGGLPYYDCDTWDKEGWFYKEVTNYEILSVTTKHYVESMYSEISDEEMKDIENADASVSHTIIITDLFMELSFGKIDGEWKLVVINTADYDCGA